MPSELWETREFDDILIRYCNAIYNQNSIDRWRKGCITPFPKMGNLGNTKNRRCITLTSIAAKFYNALLHNRKEPKMEKILRKKENGFRIDQSTTSQILTIGQILEVVWAKNTEANFYSSDFLRYFTPYKEGRWGKYFSLKTSQRNYGSHNATL